MGEDEEEFIGKELMLIVTGYVIPYIESDESDTEGLRTFLSPIENYAVSFYSKVTTLVFFFTIKLTFSRSWPSVGSKRSMRSKVAIVFSRSNARN